MICIQITQLDSLNVIKVQYMCLKSVDHRYFMPELYFETLALHPSEAKIVTLLSLSPGTVTNLLKKISLFQILRNF